tara:strand:- start:19 stop:603 length:585 start_codon:yes stop_codon:yes gene_type:complete
MKKIIIIFLFILNLQSFCQAADISEFEIEGMSVGDSLLDYFDEKKLKEIKETTDFKKKIHNKYCDDSLSSIYFDICIYTIAKDTKYKIESIAGFIDCKDDINICYKKQNEIDNEIKSLFQKAKREVFDYKHSGDKSGNTKERDIVYILKSKDEVGIAVLDYGKEWTNESVGRTDHLQVFVDSKNYAKFLRTDAW